MLRDTLKSLFRHSAIYSLGWIGSSAAGILLLPVYTRYLTKADYGALEVLAYLNEVLSLLMLAGFNHGLAKFYQDAEDEHSRRTVVTTGITTVIVLGGTGCLLFFQFYSQLANLLLGDTDYSYFIKVDILILFTEMLYTISSTSFIVAKKSKSFVSYSIGRLMMGIVANLYCVVVLKLGALGMLYGQLISNGLSSTIVTGHVLGTHRIMPDFSLVKRMLRFTLPIVPAWLSAGIMHNADRFLVRHFCSLADVGLYALGYKFSFMLNSLMLTSFSRIWSGATMYEIAKRDDAQYQFARITTYFMTVFVSAQLALSLFAPSVVKILADEKFFQAHKVVPLVSLGLCFHAFYAFFTVGAYVKSKTWLLGFSYMPAAIVNISFNIFLLPRFGYIAAAWVSVITYGFFAVVAYLSCRGALTIHFEAKRLALLFFYAILIYVASRLVHPDNLFVAMLKSGVFFFLFCILLLTTWLTEDEKSIVSEKVRDIKRLAGIGG